MSDKSYDTLDPDKIVATIDRLSRRISERFPKWGLLAVSRRLHELASRAKERSAWIARRHRGLRAVSWGLGIVVIAGLLSMVLSMVRSFLAVDDSGDVVQVLDSGFNVAVLSGAVIVFLFNLESRLKRRRALQAIHEIRAVAHIIDMHQLTKNPERTLGIGPNTATSPEERMSRFELGRYLDYCGELLSLAGKVAALYVQRFDDPVAIASANEVEDLCTGLSRKIWQKIMVLQTLPDDARPPRPPADTPR